MIQNVIFGACNFLSFLAESLKQKQNYSKRSLNLQYSFTQKTLYYEPQLTQHCKKYTPATQPETLLTNFTANVFLVVVRKNICKNCTLEALAVKRFPHCKSYFNNE